MSDRQIQALSHAGKSVRVMHSEEWDEYRVIPLRDDGRPNRAATYFTSDKDDALATARAMVGLAPL